MMPVFPVGTGRKKRESPALRSPELAQPEVNLFTYAPPVLAGRRFPWRM